MTMTILRHHRLGALLALLIGSTAQAAAPLVIDVYHDPNCGCCKEWIKHLQANGFTVKDHPEPNMTPIKEKLGVPYRLGSCHTGVFKGKFVEGHVPAAQVVELSKRKDLVGVAVPGMPLGSPGMEVGTTRHAYKVIGLRSDGKEVVVASFEALK